MPLGDNKTGNIMDIIGFKKLKIIIEKNITHLVGAYYNLNFKIKDKL